MAWRWLPVHYVHHIHWGFGYVVLPWLPLSVGLFWITRPPIRWGRESRPLRYRLGFRIVRSEHFHDCTARTIAAPPFESDL